MLYLLKTIGNNMIYSHTEKSLRISVVPFYQDENSSSEDNHYIWHYNVYIENCSEHHMQLLSRYWCIVDAAGQKEEIVGPGVIGPGVPSQQPVIKPGELYEYSNEAHLGTPSGIVNGKFQIKIQETDDVIDVEVPSFSLDSPFQKKNFH